MNKVFLIGRLTKDPDVRYSQGENSICVARYTLAIDRRFRAEGQEPQADFISCVAFGGRGEFAEKYLHKGMKISVIGRLQSGSYEKDGQTHYTTDVVVEEHEFCESRGTATPADNASNNEGGFVPMPEDDDQLPFQ